MGVFQLGRGIARSYYCDEGRDELRIAGRRPNLPPAEDGQHADRADGGTERTLRDRAQSPWLRSTGLGYPSSGWRGRATLDGQRPAEIRVGQPRPDYVHP